jgi:hypothetical protein
LSGTVRVVNTSFNTAALLTIISKREVILRAILCPTEEESGMLKSSFSGKCSHVWMGGKKGDVWG